MIYGSGMWTRVYIIAAIIGVSLLTGLVGWYWTVQTTLARNAVEAERRLTLAVSRLEGQLDQYRRLPHVIADSQDLFDVLDHPDAAGIQATDHMLERMADVTGALDIYLLDTTGLTIAASNWSSERTFKGQNYKFRPYFRRAMQGGLGVYYALGSRSLKRGFYFSSPVIEEKDIVGVVTVKVDPETLEHNWQKDEETILFTDRDGVIFMSNRPNLLFRALHPIPPERLSEITESKRYLGHALETLPKLQEVRAGGHTVFRPTGGSEEWMEALDGDGRKTIGTREIHRLELTGYVLLNAEPAFAEAAITGGLAGVVVLAGGLAVLLVAQRRAALAERLRIETRANEQLEVKVEDRTRALTDANRSLEREVDERRRAEEALRNAQADLVQAGKMSALGQMSAAISHELNQPLLAIRSFADNARHFATHGEIGRVDDNLGQIANLTQRMARIIRNLKAFARKETEAPMDVALDTAVVDALELMEKKLDQADVEVTWQPPADPVFVRGGGVRLSQVMVNVVSNAIDAMVGADVEVRRIEIDLADEDPVKLTIRDTGPGFDEATRRHVFDPFFTTKSEDAGEGLGLGLSISQRIVTSFGGTIEAGNHPEGGAIVTITLVPAAREAAA